VPFAYFHATSHFLFHIKGKWKRSLDKKSFLLYHPHMNERKHRPFCCNNFSSPYSLSPHKKRNLLDMVWGEWKLSTDEKKKTEKFFFTHLHNAISYPSYKTLEKKKNISGKCYDDDDDGEEEADKICMRMVALYIILTHFLNIFFIPSRLVFIEWKKLFLSFFHNYFILFSEVLLHLSLPSLWWTRSENNFRWSEPRWWKIIENPFVLKNFPLFKQINMNSHASQIERLWSDIYFHPSSNHKSIRPPISLSFPKIK